MVMVTEYSVYCLGGSYSCKMNGAGDGDDEEADDDGGHRDVESVPAEPLRPVVVSKIIVVPRLSKEITVTHQTCQYSERLDFKNFNAN